MRQDDWSIDARFYVGTIGFSYAGWQPGFYPAGTASGDFLSAYGTAFDAVELDTTFYANPPVERVRRWAQMVPDDFLFCVKTPRVVTHDSPLAVAGPAMGEFLGALAPLEEAGKLGPILIQFPPSFTRSGVRDLRGFLAGLPQRHRYAVELRHRSWNMEATAELLVEHRCAWVAADYLRAVWPLRMTTDFLYLRFVGRHRRFGSDDVEREDLTERMETRLEETAAVLRARAGAGGGRARVFAMFANDYAGHAPATANRFRRLVGMEERRVREERDVMAQGKLF